MMRFFKEMLWSLFAGVFFLLLYAGWHSGSTATALFVFLLVVVLIVVGEE